MRCKFGIDFLFVEKLNEKHGPFPTVLQNDSLERIENYGKCKKKKQQQQLPLSVSNENMPLKLFMLSLLSLPDLCQ